MAMLALQMNLHRTGPAVCFVVAAFAAVMATAADAGPAAPVQFFRLRESCYKGPIDQDGNKANCLTCDRPGCTRQGFSGRCS